MGCGHDAHPVLHLGRDAIIADDRPRIAQAAGLPLHYKAPQRVAGCGDEFCPRFTVFAGQKSSLLGGFRMRGPARRRLVCRHTIEAAFAAAIEFGQRQERRLQRAAQTAKRGRLLLCDFVIERDGLPCAAGSGA